MAQEVSQALSRKVGKNELIYNEGDLVKEVCVIITGTVKASGKFGECTLNAGNVIGGLDMAAGKYLYNYVAEEETMICYFTLENIDDVMKAFMANKTYPGLLVSSLAKQIIYFTNEFDKIRNLSNAIYKIINEEYSEYKKLCEGYRRNPAKITRIESLQEINEDEIQLSTDLEYYINIDSIPLDIKKAFYASNEYVTLTEIKKMHECVLEMCDAYDMYADYIDKVKDCLFAKDDDNLFMRLAEMAFEINNSSGDIALILTRIKSISSFVMQNKNIEQSALTILMSHFKAKIKGGDEISNTDDAEDISRQYTVEQIKGAIMLTKNATDTILEYAEIDKEKGDKFKQLLTVYNSLPDKFATTDDVSKIRKAITKQFYEIYEKVFIKAEETKVAEPVIDLFLNYGFVDEKFITENQLVQLFYSKIDCDTKGFQIYTMKEWLHAIYTGQHETSKNEFDTDYVGVLREKKKIQRVSEAEEKAYLSDYKARVSFEIQNMFTSVNRATSGKILTFCPVLHKDNINGEMDKNIMTKARIVDAYERLLDIDYSLFHREVLYHDEANGIVKEFIQKQVYPITILMPNAGSLGSMWQETSGARKDTPARFAFPSLCKEDAFDLLLKVAARYRWEICRNIQGIYWSDVTEKSLTSEFYDYLQFYRKNRDLSAQMKEKIKTALTKARNNYREVFVQDYITWIVYETQGAIRLNKIVRTIMLTYCPINAERRAALAKSPAFSDLIEKYEIKRLAKIKRIENAHTAIRKSGGNITDILEENLEFYNK